MNGKEKYVVITFFTTAEAMATEKICKEKCLEGKLISAPRSLSSDCGIAWRSPIELSDRLKSILNEAEIEFAGSFEVLI